MLRPSPPALAGFIEPCQPTAAKEPPSGPGWIHEIKHDGYHWRFGDGAGIRLITKNGYDGSARYPLIVEAVNALRCRSCLIDGEAVWCGEDGIALFDGLRRRGASEKVFLRAFDLLELRPRMDSRQINATIRRLASTGLQSVATDNPRSVLG
jgi:bifunctional non-homologous end joining protein LigD